jgi:hypothetical protein
MPATLLQYQQSNNGGASNWTTPSYTFGVGNLIIVGCVMGVGGTTQINTLTDQQGDTFSRISSSANYNGNLYGGNNVEFWYAYNSKGGSGTMSMQWVAGSGGYGWYNIAEYSGFDTSDPFDTAAGYGGNGTPSVGLTLAHANELIVSYGTMDEVINGWVWTDLTNEAGTTDNLMYDTVTNKSWGDYQGAAAGAYTVTGTGGTANQYNLAAAAFKFPSAASPAKPVILFIH